MHVTVWGACIPHRESHKFQESAKEVRAHEPPDTSTVPPSGQGPTRKQSHSDVLGPSPKLTSPREWAEVVTRFERASAGKVLVHCESSSDLSGESGKGLALNQSRPRDNRQGSQSDHSKDKENSRGHSGIPSPRTPPASQWSFHPGVSHALVLICPALDGCLCAGGSLPGPRWMSHHRWLEEPLLAERGLGLGKDQAERVEGSHQSHCLSWPGPGAAARLQEREREDPGCSSWYQTLGPPGPSPPCL